MASLDHFENMYDVKLKLRLLRSLTNDYLPDQNDPVSDPPDLSYVVHAIKNFGLLSESLPEPTDSKLAQDWASAVDSWVDRLLHLISSNLKLNCWIGTSLLGVTCLECPCERFLASYSVWLDKLLSHIELQQSESDSVQAASCASISDMFTRLGVYPNVKGEGISHAVKFIQPVLNLLNKDSSEALLEGAVGLFCTIITLFPSSMCHHYVTAEAAMISKFISGRYSVNTLKKYARCLALLPTSRGDEDSWSIMMQKLLIAINVDLTTACRGLKEETEYSEAIKLLVPPGKDPSAALASLSDASGQAPKKYRGSQVNLFEPSQLLTIRVPALMFCCCTMLTTSYPIEVTFPVGPILAIVWRVLMVDGSWNHPLSPIKAVMQQEFTCCELSILHLYSLDLLAAVIKGVCRQLWPHTTEIVRILTTYFQKCALATLRIKVYSVTRVLLIAMGVGIALSIDQELITNALVDLEYVGYESRRESFSDFKRITSEASQHLCHKKRKHVAMIGPLENIEDEVGIDVEETKNNSTTIPLKIAALKALEILLTVGGGLSSEILRANVDLLLINVATDACDWNRISEEESVFEPTNEPSSTWADFQLAALHALLASLLSQTRVQPCYLLRGLELFHKGKQETGTRLAEFCAHALLALEVLMHPRRHPRVDFFSGSHISFKERLTHESSENTNSDNQKISPGE